MKITVFTSNQPRHLALISRLAGIADSVYAVLECNTLFPGQVADLYQNTGPMSEYFQKVIEAEQKVFGSARFLPARNINSFAMKMGDLGRLPVEKLAPCLNSDYYIVFGASYIQGELCEILIENKAVNIHMGVSPFYRGSSCNFWALYDRRPEYVGATIHRLSAGLDSGDVICHVLPKVNSPMDGYRLGMHAVDAAQQALVELIETGQLHKLEPKSQDKSVQLRYSKKAEYTDAVVAEYLANPVSPEKVFEAASDRSLETLTRPIIA